MRPFAILPQSALKRSGDRILQRVVPRTIVIPGGVSGSFTAPESGEYVISAWGGGADGQTNGGLAGCSGAFCRKRVFLNRGDVISYSAGLGGRGPYFVPQRDASASIVSGPGLSMSAGAATRPTNENGGGVPGTATGGDVNINGNRPPYSGADGPALVSAEGDVIKAVGGYSINTSAGGASIKAGQGQTPSAGGGFSIVNGGTGYGGDGGDGLITISYAVSE